MAINTLKTYVGSSIYEFLAFNNYLRSKATSLKTCTLKRKSD